MEDDVQIFEVSEALRRYEVFSNSNIAILQKVKKGLQPQAVFDFIKISELSASQVEATLNKSIKTFQNYRDKNTTLDATTSEKLLKLFALYSKGSALFGTLGAFKEWLARPAFGLGNQVPNTLLDTITGIELITEELTRIEYGDLA